MFTMFCNSESAAVIGWACVNVGIFLTYDRSSVWLRNTQKAPSWTVALFPLYQGNMLNKDGAYVPSGCGSYLFWCIKLLSWPLLSAAGKWSTGFQAVMWSSLSITRVAHSVIKHITAAKLIILSLSPCTNNGLKFLTSLRGYSCRFLSSDIQCILGIDSVWYFISIVY